ncbi:MAG: P1 family peptidase [Bacillota bacterium]
MSAAASSDRTGEAREARELRPRARDIGIDIGILRPGRDVKAGHCTLVEGEGSLTSGKGPVRTGVTAIVPHEGNLFREKVPAAAYAFNAFGKSIGLQQVNELGNLEVPIVLTNTLNVPLVADAVVDRGTSSSPSPQPSAFPMTAR